MIEELNKSLDILELNRIKEILPDYIHKTSKDNLSLTEQLNYLLSEEIKNKDERAAEGIIKHLISRLGKLLMTMIFPFNHQYQKNK